MKNSRCLQRCSRCSCEWIPSLVAEGARCPRCGSWNSRPVHASRVPWLILALVVLATCYFLKHPQDLARLVGL